MSGSGTCPSCGASVGSGHHAGGLCAACLLDSALQDDSAEHAAESSSTDLASGSLFATLRIVRLLGKGGMASVYEAYDARLDRPVALKVLPPQFLHDETFARRFQQEARLVARLTHPCIVPIYASGIEAGVPWMTMRLLTSGSVDQLLQGQPLATPVALAILADVGSALDHAHAAGVIHRDVKPTNILLDEDGRASLSDFGLARMLTAGHALTRTGAIAGTPQYMSPEHALGLDVDQRSDVYSLGVVAYELFAGHVPFDDEAPLAVLLKHVNDPVPVPPDNRMPSALMRAVGQALAKRPAERWGSAGECVDGLRRAVQLDAEPVAARHRRRQLTGGVLWLGSVIVALFFISVQHVRRDAPVVLSPPLVGRVHDAPRDTVAALPSIATPTDHASIRSPAPASRPATATPSVEVAREAPSDAVSPNSSSVIPENGAADRTESPVAAGALTDSVGELPAPETNRVSLPGSPSDSQVVEPVRVRSEKPVYPPLARAASIEGDVSLMAQVGPDGTVTSVDVLQAPHPLLAEAARKAVLRFLYTPGSRNGIPAAFSVRVAIRFRLQ